MSPYQKDANRPSYEIVKDDPRTDGPYLDDIRADQEKAYREARMKSYEKPVVKKAAKKVTVENKKPTAVVKKVKKAVKKKKTVVGKKVAVAKKVVAKKKAVVKKKVVAKKKVAKK